MSLLPDTDRILLGPGPSLTAPRVMRAMAAPTVSHLDPLMLRAARRRARAAGCGCFARRRRLVRVRGLRHRHVGHGDGRRQPGRRRARGRSVVVTGYFGDRLAQMCERYGAVVTRLDVEWGRACDPDALRRALKADAGRHRRDGARRDVDRRAEPGRASWRRSRASTAR